MGCVPSKEQGIIINVATLNYSGILLSPYEFYASEEENKVISKCSETFFKLAQKEFPEFVEKSKFKWEMGKIDQIWQKERYSPIYSPTCGIKEDGILMNEEQFINKWDESLTKFKKPISQVYSNKTENEQMLHHINRCRSFDILCYKTLLKQIYDIDDFQDLKLQSGKYKQYQRQMFSKNFLNQNEKTKLILQALKRDEIDILFLQEATDKVLKDLQKNTNEFRVCKPSISIDKEQCRSVILIREQKFPRQKKIQDEKISPDEIAQLNWNNDTVIRMVDNLIFISAHLSSKEEKNQQQISQMRKSLFKLKMLFPSHNIICAGDINGTFKIQTFEKNCGSELTMNGKTIDLKENNQMKQALNSVHFNVYPKEKGITVNKKRTMMQAQRKKADQLIYSIKDYIVSDLEMTQTKIKTITGMEIKQTSQDVPFLPNKDHPYDHYLVTAKIKIPQVKQPNKNESGKNTTQNKKQ